MKIDLPAFPTNLNSTTLLGMTLRDYFATAALTTQMMYSADEIDLEIGQAVAQMAYKIADAMMEARK
jgi:hypothetical protein